MKQFIIDELSKTLNKLKETDPSTPAYHATLQSLEFINGMAETLEAACDIVENGAGSFYPDDGRTIEAPEDMRAPAIKEFKAAVEAIESVDEPTAELPATTPAPEHPTKYTKADLRKALYAAKEEGVDITELLGKYGAKNVNDVKESDYPEIIGMYGAI